MLWVLPTSGGRDSAVHVFPPSVPASTPPYRATQHSDAVGHERLIGSAGGDGAGRYSGVHVVPPSMVASTVATSVVPLYSVPRTKQSEAVGHETESKSAAGGAALGLPRGPSVGGHRHGAEAVRVRTDGGHHAEGGGRAREVGNAGIATDPQALGLPSGPAVGGGDGTGPESLSDGDERNAV